MNKVRYLFRFMFKMNFKKMFSVIKQIAKENNKLSVLIFFDIIWCALRYGAGYSDYFNFNFVIMSAKRRKTFITRGINNEFIRKLNNKSECQKLENKIYFNKLFKDFLGRDWVYLKDITSDQFAEFIKGKQVIIAKPIGELCGHGVEKILLKSVDNVKLYNRLIKNNQLLVEDYIIQNVETSNFYCGSVNTVRIVTITNFNDVHIVFRALRIGSGTSAVDNFHFGGMIVILNSDGEIITDAVNEKNEIFSSHPDTGIVFKGRKIPFLKEAEEKVKLASKLIPEIRYIGWDVAITENGAILIEANHNPAYDFFQTRAYMESHENGLLPAFKSIIK